MKKSLLLIVFCFTGIFTFAQVADTAAKKQRDTKTVRPKTILTQKDSLGKPVDSIIDRKDSTANRQLIKVKPKPGAVQIDSSIQSARFIQAATDTIKPPIDSTIIGKDSLPRDSNFMALQGLVPKRKALNWQQDTLFANMLKAPFRSGGGKAVFMIDERRSSESKDAIFYVLAGMVLFLAFIKAAFPRYFQNFLRLLSQKSFRQKQNRENLRQDNLPSLFLNLLFIISGGLFISLLADHQKWIRVDFWWLFLYCAGILTGIYTGKYLVIKFSGWVFNAKEATGMYAFIVFMINKVLGIVLVPLVILIAFSEGVLVSNLAIITAFIAGLLLLYRYIVSLAIIRNNLKISPLHFFIYLCAVEIIPILVIYKVLFNYIGKSI